MRLTSIKLSGFKSFAEPTTFQLPGKLVATTSPRYARITAKWNVRGGIYTTVVAEHRKKGWKPAPAVTLPQHAHEDGLPR